jgi:hypothetical protein
MSKAVLIVTLARLEHVLLLAQTDLMDLRVPYTQSNTRCQVTYATSAVQKARDHIVEALAELRK